MLRLSMRSLAFSSSFVAASLQPRVWPVRASLLLSRMAPFSSGSSSNGNLLRLIEAYRCSGHLFARLDPLADLSTVL